MFGEGDRGLRRESEREGEEAWKAGMVVSSSRGKRRGTQQGRPSVLSLIAGKAKRTMKEKSLPRTHQYRN